MKYILLCLLFSILFLASCVDMSEARARQEEQSRPYVFYED